MKQNNNYTNTQHFNDHFPGKRGLMKYAISTYQRQYDTIQHCVIYTHKTNE